MSARDKTTQTAFRLPVDLVEQLDALAERLQGARARHDPPGLPAAPVTRADVVRMLLVRGLAELAEQEQIVAPARLVPANNWQCPDCGLHLAWWQGDEKPAHTADDCAGYRRAKGLPADTLTNG